MCNFSEKRGTKGKEGQNIWKFEQKYTKFANILKKGNLMCVTIACMKQLEYALAIAIWHFEILYKYKHVYHIFFDRKGLVIGDIR